MIRTALMLSASRADPAQLYRDRGATLVREAILLFDLRSHVVMN
jgi:hypothetical protein